MDINSGSKVVSDPPRRAGRRHSDVVVAAIRDGIVNGRWPIGSRLPTTREMARTHQVGLNTVRIALSELTAEGVIRTRQGSGVYVLQAPRHPAKLGTIGVIVPNNEYFGQAIDGVEQVSSGSQFKLLLSCSHYDSAREQRQLQEMLDAGVDGLILAPTDPTLTNDAQMLDPPVPTVFMERTPPNWRTSRVSYVTSDLAGGVYSAVQHLLGHGRRRIGYYGPSDGPGSADSFAGYRQALDEASLDMTPAAAVDGEMARVTPTEFAIRCRDLALDGVFVLRESWSIELLAELRGNGMAVGEDIAMMEFCGPLATFAEAPLSGIALQRHEIGRTAGQMLLRMIELGDAATVCDIHYQPRLMIRRSCGCDRSIRPDNNTPNERTLR